MPDQRRRGRFAIGAGDPDHFRTAFFRQGLHRAGEQFHVADDRDIHHLRHAHQTMRLREAERNAGRQDQRCEFLPVALIDVADIDAFRLGLGAGRFPIIPGMHARTARSEGFGSG